LFQLVWSFLKQTLLKQFLTEGERFVMTFLAVLPLDQQGLFHVVGNVGSLAARFVFAPVEEASFLHFSQCLHRSDSAPEVLKSTANTSARTLTLLMRAMTLIGLLGVTFGIPYSSTVLWAYGGAALTSDAAVQLLRFQCAYIALIALNGILETFTFASMSTKQLARFNYALIALSLLFVLSCTPLVQSLGLCGFVVASCLPMIGRIAFG
jgi:oligosaccharide translocation protein RFT1